ARHAKQYDNLEHEPYLASDHQVGDLELAQLHDDAGIEQVAVAEPRNLHHDLAVAALLGEDGVEVEADLVAERCAREQLDQVRRLKIGGGIRFHLAADGIDGFAVTDLHESLRSEERRVGKEPKNRRSTSHHE